MTLVKSDEYKSFGNRNESVKSLNLSGVLFFFHLKKYLYQHTWSILF